MTKEQALQILELLSALEAADLMQSHRLPDYLYDEIAKSVAMLREFILK